MEVHVWTMNGKFDHSASEVKLNEDDHILVRDSNGPIHIYPKENIVRLSMILGNDEGREQYELRN